MGKVELAAALMAGSVHELRNLLGAAEMALAATRLAPDLEQALQRAARAERQVGRAQRLLSAMLSVAQGRAVEKESVSLLDLIGEARTEGTDLLGAVQFDVAGVSETQHVAVEPLLFSRVLLNLFANAAQAMGGSGRVVVGASGSGPEVVVSVQDDGPGMDPALLERAETTKPDGSGIGLVVVRAIVQAHGGQIEVGPSAGSSGARFLIRLPG